LRMVVVVQQAPAPRVSFPVSHTGLSLWPFRPMGKASWMRPPPVPPGSGQGRGRCGKRPKRMTTGGDGPPGLGAPGRGG
jgi:hypothetical protein